MVSFRTISADGSRMTDVFYQMSLESINGNFV